MSNAPNQKNLKVAWSGPQKTDERRPTHIRIVAAPPGEAPEEVRRAWVGIRLPIVDNDGRPHVVRSFGVITGPKSFFAALGALLFGKTKRVDGFRVHAPTAIGLLESHAPDAAAWWRTHLPHYCRGNRLFVFHAAACEIDDETIDPDVAAS